MKSHRVGFGQLGEEDEKVALVSPPPPFGDSGPVSGQTLSDQIMK